MPAPDSLAHRKAGLLHFIPDYDNMAKASLSEGSMDGKTTVKYLQDYIKSYDDDYKDAKAVIHMLCDIVAKGGNLALNIGPRPDGRLPQKVYPILSDIGAWLKKNGFAIYETRPVAPYREAAFAYTAKGDEVYAIYLPADAENTLPSSETIHTSGKVNDILFNGQKLNFTQNGNEVHVTFPEQYDKEPAYVLTIHKI